MRKIVFSILVIAISQLTFSQEKCELIVKVENIREIKGSLKIAVYDRKSQFLSKEIMGDSKSIKSNTIQFSFKGLGEGIYAVSIFHDLNDNGNLDTNFMYIPSEPYAFSNNAKGIFGPPSFKNCQFELKQGVNKILISL